MVDPAEDKGLSEGMATGSSPAAGLVDLEKELTCSICTEILYQPLTLLDCLHTFCGYCVKEWFSWQVTGSSSSSSGGRPQLTCPSCRSHVRDTRHDAKVNTLLDLFLQSNPSKARSENEKKEIAEKYKPGENVLSVSSDPGRSNATGQELRLLAEAQGMSLREAGTGGRRHRAGSSSQTRPSSETGGVDRSRERRLEEARRRRRVERQLATPPPPRTALELTAQDSRQIEHQSSLRSLLSSSDGDSGIEEEILRQITEEGLLDGIDLHNLDPAQEDDLTERIAEAYRRRFLNQDAQARDRQRTDRNENPPHPDGTAEPRAARSQSHPSSPRSRGLDAPSEAGASPSTAGVSSERESSNRRSSPTRAALRSAGATASAAPISISESTRPRRSSQSTLPPPTSHRRAISSGSSSRTDSRDGRRQHARSRSTDQRAVSNQQTPDTQAPSSPATSNAPHSSPSAGSNSASQREHRTRHDPSGTSRPRTESRNNPDHTSSPRPSSSPSEVTTPVAPQLYPEPLVQCERCGKSDIQYELHKFCGKCKDGGYNICLHCYHCGEGCLHWFGFGYRALVNFQRKSPSSGQDATVPELPHILQSRKYLQPPADSVQSSEDGSSKLSPVNPAQRLQKGNFCDMCHSFADDCFWKCDQCNLGEWGFCNRCVNRGHCCTHPLLAIARIQPSPNREGQPPTPLSSSTGSPQAPANITSGEEFRSLTFSTKCNMCTYPIPPSSTRFHCPECNDGDYDICTNCYLKLCAQGRISKDNGRNGWRRCLAGHRMVVVGFEDREDGQRRVIVKGLVGGHAMKDDLDPSSPSSPISTPQGLNETSGQPPVPVRQDSGKWTWEDVTEDGNHPSSTGQRRRINRARNQWVAGASDVSKASTPSFPPSGGIGLRMAAVWTYLPDPEDTDEIMFPRGAIITEAENINDDWYWGCYAGQRGLFPGAHVQLIDRVGM